MSDQPQATVLVDLRGAQHLRIRALWMLGIALAALMTFSQSLADPGELLHETIEDAGTFLIAASVLGRTWCALYIGGQKFNTLVTRGPYSIVRNPLYLFSFIGAAGIGLGVGSIVLAALMATLTTGVFILVTRVEETALREAFGSSFDAYTARVPRFWPKFSLWNDDETLTISPQRVVRTFFDSAAMLLAIPMLEGVEVLQQGGWIPVLLRLP